MGAWRFSSMFIALSMFVTFVLAGCDATIGQKELTAGGRSDNPPMEVPNAPPPGTGGAGGMDGTGGSVPPDGPCAGGPLAAPIPDCSPTPVPDTGNPHADCVARINQFRAECQCLPALVRWTEAEACADGNAEYDSINGPHASFEDQPCATGARGQNECPGWGSTDAVIDGCLDVMWAEGPEDGDPDTVNGHYENMASESYWRVACGFYTTPSGEVWGVQNFN
ncbi:MAG: hypothetical protein AAF500_19435 [Myxococcota bacterium]